MLKYASTEANVKSQLSSLSPRCGCPRKSWLQPSIATLLPFEPHFPRVAIVAWNELTALQRQFRHNPMDSYREFSKHPQISRIPLGTLGGFLCWKVLTDLWGIWKQSQGLISRGSPTRSQVASIKPAEGWAIQAMLQCFSVLPQTLRSIHGVCRIQPDSRSGWDLAQGSNCKKRMMNMPNIDFICCSKNINVIYHIDFN